MRKVILGIIIILLLAGAGIGGFWFYHYHQASNEAGKVVEAMKNVVPNLGVETGSFEGMGREPLPVMTVMDHNVVGCLEIPAQDLMVPVLQKNEKAAGFPTWVGGSPVKGQLVLEGDRKDVFLKLPKADPGDAVFFTDTDGVRYNYRVTTQFHLKDWDKTDDYDLMLCYRSDADTWFVVGCVIDQ